MNRPLCLTALAPLALALAACSASSDAPAPEPTAAPAEVATETAEPTEAPELPEAPTERTDFIVFIDEPTPPTVFAMDGFLCTTHTEVADVLDRVPAPRIQLFDESDELLATQEVSGTGPAAGDNCTIFVKFLDIPVTDSYRVVFSGEDGNGTPYQHEGVTEFDQGKFDDGYTQSHKFELD